MNLTELSTLHKMGVTSVTLNKTGAEQFLSSVGTPAVFIADDPQPEPEPNQIGQMFGIKVFKEQQ